MNLNRSTITKFIADILHPKSYLEIGVYLGGTFKIINARTKVGVDPDVNTPATYHMTSDEFFETNVETFDLILVDGLHTYKQCYKDIVNAMVCLAPRGWIVVDDINPAFPMQAHPEPQPMNTIGWQGECYKAWIKIRGEAHKFGMMAISNVGIMSHMLPNITGRFIVPEIDKVTYSDFATHRNLWLNTRSWKLIKSYIELAQEYE